MRDEAFEAQHRAESLDSDGATERDLAAFDAICAELDSTEWSADTFDTIAEIIKATGREIREPQ